MNTNESRRTDRILFFPAKREKTHNNTFEMHKTTMTTTTRKQTTLKTPNENGKLVDNFFSLFHSLCVSSLFTFIYAFLMEYTHKMKKKMDEAHTKTNRNTVHRTQLGINVSSFGQRLFQPSLVSFTFLYDFEFAVLISTRFFSHNFH